MDSEEIYSYSLEYILFNGKSRLEDVVYEYEDSIRRKKQFEDKANINLIAISVYVTMIFSLIKSVNEIITNNGNMIINVIALISSLLSIYFMLYGGNISLKVIMDKNKIYKVKRCEVEEVAELEGLEELEEIQKRKESIKKIYGMNCELNEINNTIRNNYICTSYKCIRNSLIILVFIFIIGIIPLDRISEKINTLDIKVEDTQIVDGITDDVLDDVGTSKLEKQQKEFLIKIKIENK